jgi:hypothetical protein
MIDLISIRAAGHRMSCRLVERPGAAWNLVHGRVRANRALARLERIAAEPVRATLGASRHTTTQTKIDRSGRSLMR